ncbi:MAG: hypothetical protein ACE5FY_08255, partial [Nitrospiria bacterium]
NLRLLEQTNRDLIDVDQQVRALQDRRIYLKGQLATVKPELPLIIASGERILDPLDRLRILHSKHITLSTRFSPEHPDLSKVKREISAIEKVLGETKNIVVLKNLMAEERIQLQGLLEKYAKDHPDVIQSRNTISALQKEIKTLSQQQEKNPEEKPENPAFISIQTQLASTEHDLMALDETKKELKIQRTEYTRRIETSPMVEREYQSLTRDRASVLAKYNEISSKLIEAEVAEGLESQMKGERFSLIDPPSLPERPVKPNRRAVFLLGFAFSLIGGFGFAALMEGLDDTIYTNMDLERITGIAPLAIIPLILNTENRHSLIKRKISYIIGATGLVLLILITLHYLFYPLNVAFFTAIGKLRT